MEDEQLTPQEVAEMEEWLSRVDEGRYSGDDLPEEQEPLDE